jgi:hypothetical protein
VVFTVAASKGGYFPRLHWNGFSHFCSEAKIEDKRGAKLANLDLIFIQADTEMTKIPNKNALALNRFEFIETIVRISDYKYRQEGKSSTIEESIHMLMD